MARTEIETESVMPTVADERQANDNVEAREIPSAAGLASQSSGTTDLLIHCWRQTAETTSSAFTESRHTCLETHQVNPGEPKPCNELDAYLLVRLCRRACHGPYTDGLLIGGRALDILAPLKASAVLVR